MHQSHATAFDNRDEIRATVVDDELLLSKAAGRRKKGLKNEDESIDRRAKIEIDACNEEGKMPQIGGVWKE